MSEPANASTYHKARYGAWAGDPKGMEPDDSRCAKEIMCPTSFRFFQCSRKRGHGPEGAFCKQHAKMKGDAP